MREEENRKETVKLYANKQDFVQCGNCRFINRIKVNLISEGYFTRNYLLWLLPLTIRFLIIP